MLRCDSLGHEPPLLFSTKVKHLKSHPSLRHTLALLSVATLMAACATAPTTPDASTQAAGNTASRECEIATGSNLCRKRKSASVAPVASIDGESLRRSGDDLARDKAVTPTN